MGRSKAFNDFKFPAFDSDFVTNFKDRLWDFYRLPKELIEKLESEFGMEKVKENLFQGSDGTFYYIIDHSGPGYRNPPYTLIGDDKWSKPVTLNFPEGSIKHERLIYFTPGGLLPIRSHEEETGEVVRNGGECTLELLLPNNKIVELLPGEVHAAYNPCVLYGFNHGWKNPSNDKSGWLHVVKALKPEFEDKKRSSFRIPNNTYRAKKILL